MNTDRSGLSGLVIAIFLTATACNRVPVEGLEKSFSIEVQQKAAVGDKVKIDYLWVIDNSTSMCEEQVALTENFSKFTERLQESANIDARVAVTVSYTHLRAHET